MGFKSLQKNIKRLIAELEKTDAIVRRILSRKDVQDFIIKMNTEDQLFDKGIDSLGVKLDSIGGGYTAFTLSIKSEKGQPTDRVTLKDTGEFYESFRIRLGADFFVIEANTIKDQDDLTARWGKDILGLTEESTQKLIDKLKTELIEVIHQKFQEGFNAA